MPLFYSITAYWITFLHQLSKFRWLSWAVLLTSFTVSVTQAQYCQPTSSCSSGDLITYFSINNVPLSQNTGCSPNGYGSFTAVTTTVTPGVTVPFAGTISTYGEGIGVWADLNRDGDFTDSGEQLYQSTSTFTGTFSGNITIPSGTATGNLITRVRAIYSTTSPSDPCSNVSYGETEDYRLTVNAPTTYNPYTTNITATSAQLNWNNLGTASSYEVQWRPAGGTYTLITGITSTTYALNGLTTGMNYEWQMRPTGTATWIGDPVAFTTQFPCPTAPTTSQGTITSKSINLSWSFYNSSNPNPTYELQVQQTGTASYTTIITSYTSTFYSLTGLTPNTGYTWRVRANCSDFSTPRTFTTSACTAPSMSSAGTITSSSARLSWNDSENTGNVYYFQYKTSASSTWTSVASQTATSYTLTGLTNSTTYQVRVYKNCTSTVASPFSNTVNFTTNCNAPASVYASSVGHNRAELTWTNFGAGTTYNLQYKAGPAGTFQTISNIASGTATTNSYVLTGLANNTTYYFQVQTNCGGGVTSPYSSTSSFTTQCTQPSSAFATGGQDLGYNSAVLTWSTQEIGTPHELQYRPQSSGTWQSVSNITGSSSPYSYTLAGLNAGTTYVTQVRALCDVGVTSPFSLTNTFTTQSCASPYSLAVSGITSTSAQLSWSQSTTIAELSYIPASQTATGTWTTISSVTSTYGYFTYSLTGLTPNTDYAWRVRTFCSPTGSSTYATGATFRVECRTPDNPGTYSISYNSAYLSWNGAFGQLYEVQWRPQGSTSAFMSATTTSTSYQLQNIAGSYEWQVRTLCGNNGTSAFTALQTFATVCNPPGSPYTNNISSYGALLNWSTTGNGVRYNIQYRQQGSPTWNSLNDIGSTTYALPGLTNATAYEFQVQSVCSAGVNSTFSASSQFTTSCPVPTVNLSGGSNPPQIFWTPTYGVGYVVEWKARTSSTWDNISPVLNETSFFSSSGGTVSGSSLYFTLSGLSANTVYDYRVKAICAEGTNGTYTSVQSLTTTSCNPVVPTIHYSTPSFNSASLTWSSGLSIVGLSWELRWRPTGTSTWNNTQGLSSISQTLRGLRSNTAYEWQVRSLCPSGAASAYGALQSFTTVCAQPTNLASLCVTNSSVYFDWSGVSGATYELQWRAVGQPTWTTVSSLTTDAYRLTGLAANTPYEWQVRTICSANESTNFVGPITFTTLSACPAPTNPYTYNNDNSCGIFVFSWNGCSSSGATYEVQYKPQSSATWLAAGTTPNTSIVLSGLAVNTPYDIQVRTICPGGGTSAFVSAQFVTVACIASCPIPVNLYTSDITNAAGQASWSASSSQSYEFRWRAGYSTTWNSTTVTSSSYRMTGLTGDTPYEWQVRNLCTNGQASDYSLITYFRTVCNIPLNPNSFNVGATSTNLSWNGFGTGVQYEMRYRIGTGAWQTVSPISAENYNLTGLANNTTYEWQIKTLCSGGGSSNFSHSQFFTTQCAMPINAYSQFIDLTSAQLVWSGPSGSTYEVQYRPVGGTYTTLTVGTVTSYTLTGLNNGTAYEWQVRTLCSGGATSGYPAQPLTFQTVSSACAALFTIQPGDWNNAAIWSCGRVPNATDRAEVRHQVNVAGTSNNALTVSFTNQGRLTYSQGASLKLGF